MSNRAQSRFNKMIVLFKLLDCARSDKMLILLRLAVYIDDFLRRTQVILMFTKQQKYFNIRNKLNKYKTL